MTKRAIIVVLFVSFHSVTAFNSTKVGDTSNTSNTDSIQQAIISKRQWIKKGLVIDDSQKTGKAVVNICVDTDGNVISASYNKDKSTTQDSFLIAKAVDGALKTKFSKGTIYNKVQCGTITYNFLIDKK